MPALDTATRPQTVLRTLAWACLALTVATGGIWVGSDGPAAARPALTFAFAAIGTAVAGGLLMPTTVRPVPAMAYGLRYGDLASLAQAVSDFGTLAVYAAGTVATGALLGLVAGFTVPAALETLQINTVALCGLVLFFLLLVAAEVLRGDQSEPPAPEVQQ